jgi:hypothetical protein
MAWPMLASSSTTTICLNPPDIGATPSRWRDNQRIAMQMVRRLWAREDGSDIHLREGWNCPLVKVNKC